MKWHPNTRADADEDSADRNSEVTFYTRDKDGQYRLWEPPRKKLPWLLPFLVVIVVCFALIGTAFGSEPMKTTMSSGILCDTEEQARDFLTAIKQITADEEVPEIPGCGFLQFEVPVNWEPIGVFDNKYASATIIRVTSPYFGVQYTYADWTAKPPFYDI